MMELLGGRTVWYCKKPGSPNTSIEAPMESTIEVVPATETAGVPATEPPMNIAPQAATTMDLATQPAIETATAMDLAPDPATETPTEKMPDPAKEETATEPPTQ
jgi:hypothetical protein